MESATTFVESRIQPLWSIDYSLCGVSATAFVESRLQPLWSRDYSLCESRLQPLWNIYYSMPQVNSLPPAAGGRAGKVVEVIRGAGYI